MTTIDFITQLFIEVDDKLTKENKNQKHAKAISIRLKWLPSPCCLPSGVGNRAFYLPLNVIFILFWLIVYNSPAIARRIVPQVPMCMMGVVSQ